MSDQPAQCPICDEFHAPIDTSCPAVLAGMRRALLVGPDGYRTARDVLEGFINWKKENA